MTTLSQIQSILDEMQERANKATPGPWEHRSESAENIYCPAPFTPDDELLAMLMWPAHDADKTADAEKLWYETAAFIAQARTDNPALIAALRLAVEALAHEASGGIASMAEHRETLAAILTALKGAS